MVIGPSRVWMVFGSDRAPSIARAELAYACARTAGIFIFLFSIDVTKKHWPGGDGRPIGPSAHRDTYMQLSHDMKGLNTTTCPFM